MEIKRTLSNGETVTITLTKDELYEAYSEQLHLHQLEDAARAMSEAYEINFSIEELDADFDGFDDEEDAENEKAFAETYGFPFEEALSKNSTHYLLEKLVSAFKKVKTCEVSESAAWDAAINQVLPHPTEA